MNSPKKGTSRTLVYFQNNKFENVQLENVLREMKNNKTKLAYSFCELFISIFLCNLCKNRNLKKMDNLYKEGLLKMQKYLNMNIIIKCLQDVEKLKVLLFNQKQFLCFKYFAHPEICFT